MIPVLTSLSTLFKAHERLIIVSLIIGASVFGFQKYADIRANDSSAKVQAAQAQVAAQKAADAQLATQVQQTTAQYQQMVQALSAQNTQLAATIAQRNTQLSQQQATDKTLPLPQLATRWAAEANFPASELQTNGATLVVTQDIVADTVEQLDSIPVLQANLKDTQTELVSTQAALSTANVLVGQQKQEISGLQQQNADQVKADNAEIANVKAQARKSRLKWFGAGLVTGFIGGLLK